MSFSVTMPALGESVTEGTVTRWLKKEGDQIAVDEPLLEVSTDKVDTEIPSPVAGVLQKIIVQVDSTVAVGTQLAVIQESGAAAKAATPVAAAPATPPPPPPPPPPAAPAVVVQAPTPPPAAPAQSFSPAPVATKPITATASATRADDAYVTPIVRKLATEAGVNLATINGTGVGGRIRKEDILAAVPRAAATPTAVAMSGSKPVATTSVSASPLRGTTVTMSRLRKVIADRMVESLKISAQLTTVVEVDVTKIDRLRNAAKASFEAREGVKLTFLPFFCSCNM